MSEEKRPAVTEEVKEARKLTEEELAKVNGSGADNSNKMQVGLRFVIREGGRTVGSGRVVKVLD